jgi:hypothetical protein
MWGISVSRLFSGRSNNSNDDTSDGKVRVDGEDACTAADVLEALVAILEELPDDNTFSGPYESKQLARVAENIRLASRHTDPNSRIGAAEWERTLRGILDLQKG